MPMMIRDVEILSQVASSSTDTLIRQSLNALSVEPDYWDFRRGATRDALHGLSQYPAMMVPAMQSAIFDVIFGVIGKNSRVLDPFVGSGTTLLEAMRRDLHFTGQDINPLAILICLVKKGPLDIIKLENSILRVDWHFKCDESNSIDVDFPGITKWFSASVATDLSRLRRAIKLEDDLWVRRVLWVILAETVRHTSNSRTSTFKLHIRANNDLSHSKESGVLARFSALSKEVLKCIREELEQRKCRDAFLNYRLAPEIILRLCKTTESFPEKEKYNVLITSPPYGDGLTTIPYGQYSYLPLQWIELNDITENATTQLLRTTQEIDTQALGGSLRNALKRATAVRTESLHLSNYLNSLKDFPSDRIKRVAAFFADFGTALDAICAIMQPCSYMVWVVGNRCVGGIVQPFDAILQDLLEYRGCKLVERLERAIPSKRMASRNSVSPTMKQEYVLIMRTGGKL